MLRKNHLHIVKYVLFIMSFFLIQSCCWLFEEPRNMDFTPEEEKWSKSINKKLPYQIELVKGLIFHGSPDILDSAFGIHINYDTTILNYDYEKNIKKDFYEIARSYSKIRDYKEDVSYLDIYFSADKERPNLFTEEYRYNISKDTLILIPTTK